jgi:hypothetical protein
VSRQSIANMSGKINATAKIVLTEFINATPNMARTADRSLVARDIKSPVR